MKKKTTAPKHEFVLSHKNCWYVFIEYIFTAVILSIVLGLGIIFWKFVFLRYIDFNDFFKSPTDPLSLTGVIGILILTIAEIICIRRSNSTASIIVVSIFALIMIIIFGGPVLAGLSSFFKLFFDFKINISLYWIIFLPPVIEFVLTAIIYMLFSIGDKWVKLFKINISTGISGLLTLGASLIINLTYMSSTNWTFDSSYVGRIMMMLTPIVGFVVIMINNIDSSSDRYQLFHIVKAVPSTIAVDGSICSIFGILLIFIPLILGLLMISGSFAGGTSSTKKVYKDQYGDEYTKTGLEYTKTKDGSKWKDGTQVGEITKKE